MKCDKSKDVWLVRESIVDIGEIIRKCSDVGFDQSPIRSRNTIIYYKSELSVQDRSTFLNGLTQALIQHYSSKCS